MKKRIVSILLTVILVLSILPLTALAGSLSNFGKVNTYSSGMFTDIPSTQWYADEVQLVYEFGLFNGKTSTTFEPESFLKISEAIKLAACLHSIYNTGAVTLTNGTPLWYRTYVDYALANGIITSEYPNYDAYATRADFAMIFAKAMPAEALTAMNTVKDNAIPDVQLSYSYGPAVYLLYRAGILTGSGTNRAYSPNNNIKRSEVSAIAARMASTAYRQTFSMTATETELTSTEIAAKCSPAVFYVEIYDSTGKAVSSGSGFFISASGLAVTNFHVIAGAGSAKIKTTDGKSYDIAGVYSYSEANDLALIQVNGSGFSYLEMADSTALLMGAKVYAIGYPLGLTQNMTQGAISNPIFSIDGVSHIMIDASISPGNSGGALINSYGKVIGVTTAYIDGGQNLNLAVPIHLTNGLSRTTYAPLSTIVKPQSEYKITATPSSVSVAVGSTATITITDVTGEAYSAIYVVEDPTIASCTAGEWVDSYSAPIYIKGLKAGSTNIAFILVDENDNILARTKVSVTVTGGSTSTTTTYYAGYYPVVDLGSYAGIPLFDSEYNYTYSIQYYLYSASSVSGDVATVFGGYFDLLEENGFTYKGYEVISGYNVYYFENASWTVGIGIRVINGVEYVQVMIVL